MFFIVCVVFGNSRVEEEEGIGLGGIILQGMRIIGGMGLVDVTTATATATATTLLPGIFGLGIYPTIL